MKNKEDRNDLHESNNIEFAAKESIKKTQQAYENLVNKRKEKEIKVTHQNTSARNHKNNQDECYNEPHKNHQLSLDEQLGFSSESDSNNDANEELKEDKDFVVDEALSDTSEDDFPLNKLGKQSPRKSIAKNENPTVLIAEIKEDFYIEELNKSEPKQTDLASQPKSEHNNETDEVTEDTM